MEPADLEKIKSTCLFEGLSEDVIRGMIGNEPPRNYPKGKILFQQGEEADHFYVILSGWVKLYRLMPTGDEAILHIFTERETFAEAAMFNGHLYPATAEVVADARLLTINANRFEEQLAESPKIALRMLASTTAHMKMLVTEVEQIKGRNSVQRLAYFLIKMCPQEAVSAVVTLPYEKSLIASRLGIQPESLSRVLNKLRAFGVNCTKNQVDISDVQALEDLALGKELSL